MREIKFRAWDKKKKKMIDSHMFMCGHFDEGCLHNCFTDKNFDHMQYTGLKDKNGKDIFESDIVYLDDRAASDDDCHWEGIVKFKNGAFVVEIHREWKKWDELIIKERRWHWNVGDSFNLSRTKVIGNIYENPELLK